MTTHEIVVRRAQNTVTARHIGFSRIRHFRKDGTTTYDSHHLCIATLKQINHEFIGYPRQPKFPLSAGAIIVPKVLQGTSTSARTKHTLSTTHKTFVHAGSWRGRGMPRGKSTIALVGADIGARGSSNQSMKEDMVPL